MKTSSATLISGYVFADIPDYEDWRAPLHQLTKQQLCGTIILAPEGINLSLYGAHQQLQKILDLFNEDGRFNRLILNRAALLQSPFKKMKIKVKKEIMPLHCPKLQPHKHKGRYLSPQQWDAFIRNEDVLTIDARNDFENALGSFPNAINPRLNSFRQFPRYIDKHLEQWQQRRIALFCTGGIRCEKVSCYLEEKGLTDVFQLRGGIIRYLQEISAAKSSWEGDCFVFDERISIKGKA